jgi:hypothetical protein
MLARAVAEVLEEAVTRVERRGFCQGEFWNRAADMYCTRGHFTQAALDLFGHGKSVAGIESWTTIIVGCDMVMSCHLGRDVAVWNDEPGRTADEVVAALSASAADAREWCAA